MAIEPLRPAFQAAWNPALKPIPAPPWRQKLKAIWDVVYFILSILIFPIAIARAVGYAVAFAAKKMALPSAWLYSITHGDETWEDIKRGYRDFCNGPISQSFAVDEHWVKTPDQVNLHATHFRHRHADANTPTIILYPSNMATTQHRVYRWLIERAHQRNAPCNFVVFDYRGVSKSEGEMNRIHDLVVDGDSIYQFVRDHLHVPPASISHYGWSLGGCVSAHVKGLHPESDAGTYISERSFASSRHVASSIIPRRLRPLLFWFPWAVHQQDWNFTAPYNNLRGRLVAVYHPNDDIIHDSSSFYRGAEEHHLPIEKIELEAAPHLQELASRKYIDHHSRSLEDYLVKGTTQLAADAIADLILPPAMPAAGVA
jgi:hypothetical protein